MESTIQTPTAFDYKYVSAIRRRRVLRTWGLRILASLALLAALFYGALHYFSNLPRERNQSRAGMPSRIETGLHSFFAAASTALTTDPAEPKDSQLPVLELYIPGRSLDSLNADLPESGTEYQKGLFKSEGKVTNAKLRYRGDSLNHWSFPYKSWRVNLSKGHLYKGMEVFNLYLPRTSSQVAEYLGYELSKRMPGIHAPYVDLVHFRLNRQYNGMRMVLEQVTASSMPRRGKAPGKIFHGDISTKQIYAGVRRPNLFTELKGWEIDTVDYDRGVVDQGTVRPVELEPLQRALLKIQDPLKLRDALERVIDIDAFARFMAYLELISTSHIDNTHNQKFYLNPDTGLFEPILYDPIAYLFGRRSDLDFASNFVFQRLLEIPSVRDAKNRYLWSAIHGELSPDKILAELESVLKRAEPEIRAAHYKIGSRDGNMELLSNAGWEEAVASLRNLVTVRHNIVRNHLLLSSHDFGWQSSDARVDVEVKTADHSGVIIDAIEVDVPEGTVASLRRDGSTAPGVGGMSAIGADGKHVLRFPLNDHLMSLRASKRRRVSIVPGVYRYTIDLTNSGKTQLAPGAVHLEARHPRTLERVVVPERAFAALATNSWWDPRQFEQQKVENWSGRVSISETRDLPSTTTVNIAPGTEIALSPGASLIFRGPVYAKGTASAPIVFRSESATKPFGVVALQGVKDFTFEHVSVTGGSYGFLSNITFTAPLNIHHSTGRISYSRFEESPIAIRFSAVDISDSRLRATTPTIEQFQSRVT
ncbi:MAG: CotH kinase family protein, partial [Deltaproteobacteria bacterium]|nr:CotH kinase family protein [Deltaproteobacteria bacterium]